MATLLPPPKRIKVYHGVPKPEPEPVTPSPNVVVQFVSEDDGKPLAPAVNLPANISREGLEVLVNKLSSKVRSSTSLIHEHSLIYCRMKTPFHSHSTSLYPKKQTVTHLGLSSQNLSNSISYPTRLNHSHQKISSPSTVLPNPSSASVPPHAAHPPSLVTPRPSSAPPFHPRERRWLQAPEIVRRGYGI